jgi:hypothetical protein
VRQLEAEHSLAIQLVNERSEKPVSVLAFVRALYRHCLLNHFLRLGWMSQIR